MATPMPMLPSSHPAMPPPVLDFEALLTPIPGPDPAGAPVSFAIRKELEEARREILPESYSPDDPQRPAEPIRPDWPKIIRVASETLARKSKDLLVAARLVEALTRVHRFVGLRDGLILMRRMIEEAWDRILPKIDEEDKDPEVRSAPFLWIAETEKGARFPSSLRALEIVGGGDTPRYNWLIYKALQGVLSQGGPTADRAKSKFESAINATDVQTLVGDVLSLKQSQAELNAIDDLLTERMGNVAPSLAELRQVIDDLALLSEQLLQKKGPGIIDFTSPEPPEPTLTPEEFKTAPDDSAYVAVTSGGNPLPMPLVTADRLATRDLIYRRLSEAAAALKQLEPHSPIPYLLERAIELGNMSFPQLMRELIRDAQVLGSMHRELGIKSDTMSN